MKTLKPKELITLKDKYVIDERVNQKFKNARDQLLSNSNSLTNRPDKRQIFLTLLEEIGHEGFEVVTDDDAYLHVDRSDFFFNAQHKNLIPFYCSFYVKLQLGSICDGHKARAIVANDIMLKARACRKFIITMITDLNKSLLIKTYRCDDGVSRHIESAEFGKLGFF